MTIEAACESAATILNYLWPRGGSIFHVSAPRRFHPRLSQPSFPRCAQLQAALNCVVLSAFHSDSLCLSAGALFATARYFCCGCGRQCGNVWRRQCRNVSGLAWSVMPTKERCPKLCWRRFSGRGTTDHFSACNIVTAILGRRAKSEFNFPHESKDAIRRNIRYQRRDTPKHFARCDSLRAIFLALAA